MNCWAIWQTLHNKNVLSFIIILHVKTLYHLTKIKDPPTTRGTQKYTALANERDGEWCSLTTFPNDPQLSR